ncbi:MAG: hypothetical protein ACLQOO_26525 [Terriglobia bacterium]
MLSPQRGRYGYRGGRIRDDRFRAHFGREHMFRINSAYTAGGYSRFRYGGVQFGMYDPWPAGWSYTIHVHRHISLNPADSLWWCHLGR